MQLALDGGDVYISETGDLLDSVVIDEVAMAPMRDVFEAFGAQIQWDNATKTVVATRADKTMVVTVGSPIATVNGQTITLAQPACILNGKTMIPARAVAENFGATVRWDGSIRQVTISNLFGNETGDE